MKKIKVNAKQQVRPTYSNKLTKTEFYDAYGVSLAYGKTTLSNEYLLSLLLPVAKKYYDITYHALTAELRYFLNGGDTIDTSYVSRREENEHILKRMKIKNWKKIRKQLTLNQIYILFHCGSWKAGYGGEKWTNIVLACKGLYNELQNPRIPQLCRAIDYLNQLEHNNQLYLSTYSTFKLFNELYFKDDCSIQYVYKYCSPAVAELQKFFIEPC
jgi:hypothetical protein